MHPIEMIFIPPTSKRFIPCKRNLCLRKWKWQTMPGSKDSMSAKKPKVKPRQSDSIPTRREAVRNPAQPKSGALTESQGAGPKVVDPAETTPLRNFVRWTVRNTAKLPHRTHLKWICSFEWFEICVQRLRDSVCGISSTSTTNKPI